MRYDFYSLYRLVFVLLLSANVLSAQDLNFDLKVSPSVNMVFNTIEKYEQGLVQYNFNQLNIVSDVTWDLYVGANTSVPDLWDEEISYSNSGATPPLSILQLRVRNSNNTQQIQDFFSLTDIALPTYLIGSSLSDNEKSCDELNSNMAGTYKTSPGCMSFDVDIMIKPGLEYRAGQYKVEIIYTIIENL